jgi:hypothetical protein
VGAISFKCPLIYPLEHCLWRCVVASESPQLPFEPFGGGLGSSHWWLQCCGRRHWCCGGRLWPSVTDGKSLNIPLQHRLWWSVVAGQSVQLP